MNIENLNTGEKTILIGCIVSILSLFMTWVDVKIVSENGFQQEGYLFVLFWLYPCIQAIKQRNAKKNLSVILVAISIICMFAFINDKSVNLFGTSISAAGTGMYVMMLSLIVILIGCIMNKRI